ncbi:MAG: polysaccharide pyruvyl transferase family protein [Bacteroidetes bacterium]|nr:MAG: polysaccharide pyruvyl transferase family protein [Bacteroidota bacterium]
MNILLIGQTTLHWGRMEYGNIGNYYIIEPFIRELHKFFPNSIIKTTLQMSDEFCYREKIVRLPMELYYSWDDPEYLNNTLKELGIAELYSHTKKLMTTSPFIKVVSDSDLVIDFSGDIWGDNANFLGTNRFLIGLMKDRIAQLLGKKTVMLAGSPGPFNDNRTLSFAKLVYDNFDLVTNRESISTDLLRDLGFNLSRTKSLACPAFLFEPKIDIDIDSIFDKLDANDGSKNVGFVICGWNLLKGPFDRWPIDDEELLNYVKLIETIINKENVNVILMSHSNGFELPPYFKLKHGRDYPFAEQLFNIIRKRNNINIEKIKLQKEVLDPWTIKAFIGKLDVLISGRIHGAVAGLSQLIPTVIIDYGHEPKAHKLQGFAKVVGMQEMIVDPQNEELLIEKSLFCINNRDKIKDELRKVMPKVKELAISNFELLKELF